MLPYEIVVRYILDNHYYFHLIDISSIDFSSKWKRSRCIEISVYVLNAFLTRVA